VKAKKTHINKSARAHKLVRIGILLVFICGYLLLAVIPDLRPAVPELLGITAALTILLSLVLYLGQKGLMSFSPVTILIMAAGFRLLFVFHSPQMSDDIYRYLFDGRRLISGHNPYAFPPDSADLRQEGLTDLAAKVNNPHLVTIYPPGAQLVFAAGALLGGITGMKLLLIGLDLILVMFILRLLSALKLPPWRAILYAWHPLAVLEISASGHIDGAGLFFAFLALCLLTPRSTDGEALRTNREPMRPVSPKMHPAAFFAGGVFFSLAILVKFYPAVFLPGIWHLIPAGGRKRFAAGFVTACLLLIASFFPDIIHSLVTLKLYSVTWEFAGFLFRFLRELFHSGVVARAILGPLFALVIVWCYLQQKAGGSKSLPIAPQSSLAAMLKSGYTIGFFFLLLTPTLHPWYALYLISFLPFSPGIIGIILSWSVLLGYRVLISYGILNQWAEDALTPLMIWGGPIAAGIVFKCYPGHQVQPEVKPGTR
jgi:hypothetical protein